MVMEKASSPAWDWFVPSADEKLKLDFVGV